MDISTHWKPKQMWEEIATHFLCTRYPPPLLSNTLELQRSHCWQTKSSPPFLYVKKRALNYPIDQIMSNVAQNIVNFNLRDISVSIFPGHLTLRKLITNVRLVVVVGVDACVAFLVVCKAGLSSGDDPSEQLPRHQSVPLRTTILELGPRDSAPRLEPRVECWLLLLDNKQDGHYWTTWTCLATCTWATNPIPAGHAARQQLQCAFANPVSWSRKIGRAFSNTKLSLLDSPITCGNDIVEKVLLIECSRLRDCRTARCWHQEPCFTSSRNELIANLTLF